MDRFGTNSSISKNANFKTNLFAVFSLKMLNENKSPQTFYLTSNVMVKKLQKPKKIEKFAPIFLFCLIFLQI